MCLSAIFVDHATEPVCSNICKIRVENGEIIACDIMGREVRLTGVINDIDLIGNTVHVSSASR